jgi:Zn-dependent peptidase ImmA (M78 family)
MTTKVSSASPSSMPRRNSTKHIGDILEKRVLKYFCAEIAADRFWAKKANCRVFSKKGYHSKDRNSKIIFDVSIELYLPNSQEYSALVLIECKNYKHSVPVDDVEEFFTKVQQVAGANAKAVIASTSPFQHGAREFAKSKGVGLLRYFDRRDFKWELKRSPSASARSTSAEDSHLIEQGLSQPEFRSYLFDLYLQSPTRQTNSLWDFCEDLILDAGLTPKQIRLIANARSRLANQVPFLEKDELEARTSEVLADIEYPGAEVNLDALCLREARANGLAVRTGVVPATGDKWSVALGRITFAPLVIEVFAAENANRARERFTLAHELAHHLLAHGRYMTQEYCDEDDFVLHRRSLVNGSDIARLEFQANYFAASLLMPRTYFLSDFQRLARALDIQDHGHGALYVDDQPCNLQNFRFVTSHLMQTYGVSRTAARIRLESLGLLRDSRQTGSLRPMLSLFAPSAE